MNRLSLPVRAGMSYSTTPKINTASGRFPNMRRLSFLARVLRNELHYSSKITTTGRRLPNMNRLSLLVRAGISYSKTPSIQPVGDFPI